MSRNIAIGLALALGPMTSEGWAQGRPPGAAYKVAFWYEADRPTDLKYQVYDLARGEYDPQAVDRWLRTIEEKHPDHGAYVRDIRTEGEPGLTEKDRLAAAIEAEKRRWTELNRRVSPPLPNPVVPFAIGRSRGPSTGRANLDRPSLGTPGPYTNPPTSPFPYPYRSRPL